MEGFAQLCAPRRNDPGEKAVFFGAAKTLMLHYVAAGAAHASVSQETMGCLVHEKRRIHTQVPFRMSGEIKPPEIHMANASSRIFTSHRQFNVDDAGQMTSNTVETPGIDLGDQIECLPRFFDEQAVVVWIAVGVGQQDAGMFTNKELAVQPDPEAGNGR